MPNCRICGGATTEYVDFGRQPLSDAFVKPDQVNDEFFFRLAVAMCESCTMVQLVEEVPRDAMFHEDYPYQSSGSSVMRKHFELVARHFLDTELTDDDPFVVEVGCNDGIMLKAVSEAGVRHLGVEPSGAVGEMARSKGVKVRTAFFEEETAREVAETEGRANVIYAANTICHIPYLDSILRGADALLKPGGVFVFEDPYFGEIVERTSFDQVYDEHFYFFTARSVRAMAQRFGFDLVDVKRLPVHGGEVRYTLARQGERTPTAAVAELLAQEEERKLADPATIEAFGASTRKIRDDLVALLEKLKAEGKRVVAYGATAKSATVANYCGLGPELVEFVSDTTPAKQHRLTPGTHIPVRPPEAFREDYPDYALLFAWNHAEEIMANERGFREAGGQWILYVPEVSVV
ncbi:class I SAM-dependent methyltransferase [Streptomyces boncukensis]|uniref:Class I SAM-dependent methyltransferase n=1 Tax=Streptomyces boncukensis TaxID=2711219 RepID=A0A6G4X5D1_9ACTN|nr:class I SAM-dependent methyltransferase [Streptomyces boncukensis]NGO72342.1 class I SAM-dependent methyltransferase [Streptomyces boncukensis]